MLKGNVLAVTSGKGGVGKSSLSVNLALALQKLGKSVAIIDLDIYGFSIPKILNIDYKPKTFNGKIIPVETKGIKLMSMGFLVNGNDPIVWRGPMLGKMIEHFTKDVLWGELDYFILDMPPGTGDVALDMHLMIPESKEIVVTTPHKAAAYVAERAGSMAMKSNHEVIGVVENMSYFTPPNGDEKYFIFGKGGGEELASQLGVELLGKLPIQEPNESNDAPSIAKEGTQLERAYLNLAQKIDEKYNG
ncbi:Mrp/NBP35 family ATP-binding protein [Mesobacillus maritimus]|uniref:Mrp/NBP35 family ATP-binding protein n=1 Tax=Mesobacillus maritimus TaxID=1643336 RepID=UPI00203B29B3|nr:Mrp/NBP35 family ATP-binding protein [Mesobacillus maritimus]MCM3585654.1 Mrp/NBP35 family ATP-binding protein [Mesobacillus maritimus]MCM3669126.1 Mrp/NBP35 family ATP-binding protein [Mesobacillus maritimus]